MVYTGSSGPDVKLLQNTLNNIGYNAGTVDGYFGPQTRQAVVNFQVGNRLAPDGVVGPQTWQALEKFILGYNIHTVRQGDTLYLLAKQYYTTLNAILTANPGINPNLLTIGQQIVVPYGIDVVYPALDYTYEILTLQIQGLKARYPFLEVGSAGASTMGKSLFTVRIGGGPNEVSYNASHHANEWITTTLLMKFLENFSKAYSLGGSLRSYSTQEIWNKCSIYLVPMVNPDGVDMVNYWPNYPNAVYQNASRLNQTGRPLPSVWKANIRGTDLNLNYPAQWQKERDLEIEEGITGPAPRDYGGPAPLSETETVGMTGFTRSHNFRLVIAYHTQGEIIYYRFNNLEPPESAKLAQLFSRASGYETAANPAEASYAGYKDWFIQEYRRPGFTIEVGVGVNPLPMSQFPTIYGQNEEILLMSGLV